VQCFAAVSAARYRQVIDAAWSGGKAAHGAARDPANAPTAGRR